MNVQDREEEISSKGMDFGCLMYEIACLSLATIILESFYYHSALAEGLTANSVKSTAKNL